MDAHLFRLLCRQLEPALAGARIEKIQEFAPDHLSLAFFGSRGKQHLYFRFGRKNPFCFTSKERVTALPGPSAAVMRLRKYFSGRRVAAVVPDVWNRRLWLMAAGAGKPVWLCLDLVHGASLHFLPEDEVPIPENPAWPPAGANLDDPQAWRKYPVLTPRLRAALSDLAPPDRAALICDLELGAGDAFIYLGDDDCVREISAWPLSGRAATGLREECSEDVAAAFERAGRDLVLRALFERRLENSLAPSRKRQKQLRKILAKLDQDEARLARMAAREQVGLAISGRLWQLEPDAKQDAVELETEAGTVRIALDPRFTMRENMERFFHEAKRGKRGLALLGERRREIERELAELGANFQVSQTGAHKNVPDARRLAIRVPAHCQGYISSDGYVMLRGRDARGNQAIRKAAAGHDIWAHVEQGSGAHVLIRLPYAGHEIPERTLIEAGTLAANKSWLAEAASGSVMYAEARHVKGCRSGTPGKVTIDRLRCTRIVPVDHGLEARLQENGAQK